MSIEDHLPSAPTKGFIRELDNIMAVEVIANGAEPPVIIYETGGKRYLVQVALWDVTDEPFYAKRGLFERLAARRMAK